MTTDGTLILLTAACAAYAVHAVVRRKLPWWFTAGALLLYLAVAVQTVILVWWLGDGRLVAGWQVNPEIKNYVTHTYAQGRWPAPDRTFCLVAILAQILVLIPRPDRAGLVRLLPVTLFFLVLFFWFGNREQDRPLQYRRALGPEQNAYLTLAPNGPGARLILAHGRASDSFLHIDLVHLTHSTPPEIRPLWTKDGLGIVLSVSLRKLAAVSLDGGIVGRLPVESHEWPEQDPRMESVAVRERFSKAQKEVAEFVDGHGGYFVP